MACAFAECDVEPMQQNSSILSVSLSVLGTLANSALR